MEMLILSYIQILLIFLIGLKITYTYAKKLQTNYIYIVYFMHTIFSLLYYLYALSNTADANGYYNKAIAQNDLFTVFESGTNSIVFISTFFVKYLYFNKLSLFFLFGLFGYIGFIYLIKMIDINKIKILGIPATYIILLLPGFHFWTSALGKDSIVFMTIMISFYSIQNLKKNLILLIFSFTILTFVRPHLGLIVLLAVLLSFILTNPAKIKFSQFIMFIMIIILIIILLPFFQNFLNLDSFDLNNIIKRTEYYNEQGAMSVDNISSYIDVSNYSLPNKMFAYLFRPLFYDAHSILQFIISFENLFILVLFFKWLIFIRFNIISWYKKLILTDRILFFYVILGWVILASSMYNLGLASRQKYMLLPIVFILINKNFNKAKNNYVRN